MPGSFMLSNRAIAKAETHGQHDETDRVNGCHFQRLRPAFRTTASL